MYEITVCGTAPRLGCLEVVFAARLVFAECPRDDGVLSQVVVKAGPALARHLGVGYIRTLPLLYITTLSFSPTCTCSLPLTRSLGQTHPYPNRRLATAIGPSLFFTPSSAPPPLSPPTPTYFFFFGFFFLAFGSPALPSPPASGSAPAASGAPAVACSDEPEGVLASAGLAAAAAGRELARARLSLLWRRKKRFRNTLERAWNVALCAWHGRAGGGELAGPPGHETTAGVRWRSAYAGFGGEAEDEELGVGLELCGEGSLERGADGLGRGGGRLARANQGDRLCPG